MSGVIVLGLATAVLAALIICFVLMLWQDHCSDERKRDEELKELEQITQKMSQMLSESKEGTKAEDRI